MHNLPERTRSWFWPRMLLIFMILTGCTPRVTSTPDATLQVTPSVEPGAASSLSPYSTPAAATPAWTSTPTGSLTIDFVQMVDRMTGWAMGQIGMEGVSRFLRTTDGGATWQDVSPGLGSHSGFWALDAQLAWVRSSENDELWRTPDGGQSWSSLGAVQGELWFNDPRHGWNLYAEEWGLSYAQFDIQSFSTTQDGGQTWQEAEVPPGAGVMFTAFPDPQTAWAIRAWFAKVIEGFPNVAVPFSLVTTSDGGKTWRSQDVPLPAGVRAIKMNDGSSYLDAGNCSFDSPVYSSLDVWKFALTCEEQGWLYTSTSQGETWTIVSLPSGQVTNVQFIGLTDGWALRRDDVQPYRSYLYRTTDGGQTWTLLALVDWAEARLDFVDDQTGWAVVVTCDGALADCNPYLHPRALAKTTDGGQTWQILPPQILP